MKFYISPNFLTEPFTVTTMVADSVISKRIYSNCPMMLTKKVTMLDLVQLYMVHFNVILGIDWLHAYFASIDCRTR